MAGTLTPERTARRLCELSADARAAVLLDAAGALAGFHGVSKSRSGDLAQLARTIFDGVSHPNDPLLLPAVPTSRTATPIGSTAQGNVPPVEAAG